MSYIGKSPAVGNFVKLDAISTSSTNTYNLTVDSVAFVPESANHMLVSLNGVIQAPLSSFSVSGSTITFLPASGTLSSSDSIDFIMVYGNVLDIGTPSDSTVTNAKTNFVSTSSNAGLSIKGDGTTDGTLQLNCSQNSHGIKIKSPPHSASASYTLTMPNNDGDADQFLQTNGSGVLSWAGVTAESNTPSFYAYGSGHTTVGHATVNRIANQSEIFDNGGCYNHTSSTVTLNGLSCPDFRFTPNVAGLYFFVGAVRMNTSNFNVGLVNNLGSTGGTETYSSLIYGTDIANHTIMVSGYSLMNGTGNNMVLTAYQESGGSVQTSNAIYTTYFGGFLVKKS